MIAETFVDFFGEKITPNHVFGFFAFFSSPRGLKHVVNKEEQKV